METTIEKICWNIENVYRRLSDINEDSNGKQFWKKMEIFIGKLLIAIKINRKNCENICWKNSDKIEDLHGINFDYIENEGKMKTNIEKVVKKLKMYVCRKISNINWKFIWKNCW